MAESVAELRDKLAKAEAAEKTEAVAEVQPQSVGGLSAQPIMVSASDLAELFALKNVVDGLKKELAAQKKLGVAPTVGPAICDCKDCSAPIIKPGEKGYIKVVDEDGYEQPYMAEGTHAA